MLRTQHLVAELNGKMDCDNTIHTYIYKDWTIEYVYLGNKMLYLYAKRIVLNASIAANAVTIEDLPFFAGFQQRLFGVQHDTGVPLNLITAYIEDNKIYWGHSSCTYQNQFDIFGIIKILD